MNYSQVFPQIFVGSYPESTGDIDTLRDRASITAVLNLQTDEDIRDLHIDWPVLQSHYASSRIVLRRCPVKDFDAEDLRARLGECVGILDELIGDRHSVYVHCTAGAGRAPSVVIAYLHWCLGWNLDRALGHVTRVRLCTPNIHTIRLATQDLWGKRVFPSDFDQWQSE